MILNRPVLAVTTIAIALLIGGLLPGDGPHNADRAGDATGNLPPSISDQALFARNLDQLRQLNRLALPLANSPPARTIAERLQAHFPSQDLIDGAALSAGRTVVSLVVGEDHLSDPMLGLIPNNVKKGASWERPGLISIYRDRRLVLRTKAGVRIHGGFPDDTQPSSFRLYFRDAYDVTNAAMSMVVPGAPGRLKRLIINKTDPAFRNAIAFDISRRVGGIAPHTAPAAFYLNGAAQGPRLLTEHVSLDFLEARFGHRDFTFLRMKGGTRAGHGSRWQVLTDRLNRQQKVSMVDADAVIDMENLMRQYAAFLFCATDDAFQGGIVKNDRSPANRWFFVNWDMEESFGTERARDYFATLGYGPSAPPVLRPVIWRKLRLDPAFRNRFSRLMTDLLDQILTRKWLDMTMARYRGQASAYGITDHGDLDQVETFLRARPRQLRRDLADFLAGSST